MDKDAEKNRLNAELLQLEAYVRHPISVEIDRNHQEREQQLLQAILDMPVHSLETAIAHFSAIGCLKGLRESRAIVQQSVETIKQEIEAL